MKANLANNILEIFSSIQGEGPFTGVKQIFVRFYDCNLNCKYCDVVRKTPPKEFSVDKLLSIIKQLDYERGKHHSISLTGGEPLLQRRFLFELLRECKLREINTVVDTSGFAAWDTFNHIRTNVDLFLYDLKMIDDDRHKTFTGVSNQLILQNLNRLVWSGAQIEIRIPLIPAINDDADNLEGTAAFLADLPNINGIELSFKGFEKLKDEIDLKSMELTIPELCRDTIIVHTGIFPTLSSKYQRLVIREAAIPLVSPEDLSIIRMTAEKYYEVCTNSIIYDHVKQKI